MVGKENEQEEDADDVVVARERKQRRGERRGAARRAAREDEEMRGGGGGGLDDALVEEGYGKEKEEEKEPRECVRMLSADSSRPEDHTRRDHRACLRPSLPIYPRSGGANKKCVSLYYIFLREHVSRLVARATRINVVAS